MTSGRELIRLWAVSLSCVITSIVNGGVFFTFGVFFKPLAADFGWTRGEVSAVWTILLASYVPSCVFLGRLADRYGPRRVLALAAILIGLGLSLNNGIDSLGFLMLNYALIGLGTGATFTVPSATILRWFVRRRGLMIGVVLAASGASGLLFAPIADHLISLYTWRNAFLLLGGVYGSLLAIAALGALNAPERLGARPYG